MCTSCNSVIQYNNTAIYAAVNISCVVFLLSVVLVASNDRIRIVWQACAEGGGADVIQNNCRGQPVTADNRTWHLLYTAYSAICPLLSYVITDVSVGNNKYKTSIDW